MKYALEYSKEALEDLHDIDQTEAAKIVLKLEYIMRSQVNPLGLAKALKGNYKGLYRFRIGNYRAIFSKDSNGNLTIITIITIGHRKDIYE
ncbi:MAG TPA: type II toxin-antitoxin system RelE/ParE family toxin [Patescibacteria group bacterium]|jgi:mRNA interferase RelE/StbE|nr:type II toxin-antitoxin system RelE/ParE family toxin [Patescibacteria group bacterium]